jgi:hypothetical protein
VCVRTNSTHDPKQQQQRNDLAMAHAKLHCTGPFTGAQHDCTRQQHGPRIEPAHERMRRRPMHRQIPILSAMESESHAETIPDPAYLNRTRCTVECQRQNSQSTTNQRGKQRRARMYGSMRRKRNRRRLSTTSLETTDVRGERRDKRIESDTHRQGEQSNAGGNGNGACVQLPGIALSIHKRTH